MLNIFFYHGFTISCASQNAAMGDDCGFLFNAATINDICVDHERKFVFD